MNIVLKWLGIEALVSKAIDKVVKKIYKDLEALELKTKTELDQEISVMRSTLWNVTGNIQDSVSDLREDVAALTRDKGTISRSNPAKLQKSTESSVKSRGCCGNCGPGCGSCGGGCVCRKA